jgi:ADP-heptose:LPS heptosyltransferase
MPLLNTLRPHSIVIFRALQVGDMLCAAPAFRALRAALPKARITLVSLPWAKWFTDRFSHYIDEFIGFPGYPGLPEQAPDISALPWFIAGMQARRFDLAIQLHGDGSRTNSIVALFGARRRAGFGAASSLGMEEADYLEYPEREHEVSRLLRLMEFIGASRVGDHLELPINAADEMELARLGVATHVQAGRYACLHPGARSAARRWPPRCFAKVGDYLHFEHGLDIVLTGSESESSTTSQVARAMRAPVIDAAGPLSIGAMAALMRRARLLISNCTAASHIAAGLRLPSIVVFTESDMQRWAPLDASRHPAVWDPAGNSVGEVIRRAGELLSCHEYRMTAEGL